jgi:DUF438 domain-containing protein
MDLVELTLSVGKLSAKTGDLLLKNWPIDVTLWMKTTRWLSTPNRAIASLPRTPAVIGRKVQMCHPAGQCA